MRCRGGSLRQRVPSFSLFRLSWECWFDCLVGGGDSARSSWRSFPQTVHPNWIVRGPARPSTGRLRWKTVSRNWAFFCLYNELLSAGSVPGSPGLHSLLGRRIDLTLLPESCSFLKVIPFFLCFFTCSSFFSLLSLPYLVTGFSSPVSYAHGWRRRNLGVTRDPGLPRVQPLARVNINRPEA